MRFLQPDPREETLMNRKFRVLLVSFFFGLVAAVGSAAAADAWFILGTQTLETANPSVEIKSEGGRWEKDVKKVKVSVEGAGVKITSLALHWDNRPDDTLKD